MTTLEGVVVIFTLTATNVNASRTTRPLVVSGIQNPYYLFTVMTSATPSCDYYRFQVVVAIGADTSNPGEIVAAIPTLPDISPIGNSLQHSIVKNENGFMVNVTFNVQYRITLHACMRTS